MPISLSGLKPPMPGPCPARGSTTTKGRLVKWIRTPSGGTTSDQPVVHRPIERAAIDDEFDLVIQHVRRGFCRVLAIAVASLPHDVPEQDAALSGIHHVFGGRAEHVLEW